MLEASLGGFLEPRVSRPPKYKEGRCAVEILKAMKPL